MGPQINSESESSKSGGEISMDNMEYLQRLKPIQIVIQTRSLTS